MESQLCWSGAVERVFWHIQMDTIPVSTFKFEHARASRHMSYLPSLLPLRHQRLPRQPKRPIVGCNASHLSYCALTF